MTSELFETPGEDAPHREHIGSISVRSESDIVWVRDRTRLVARELGFDNVTQIKLTTAVSELTRNIYEYAGTGSISVSLIAREGNRGLEIICEDQGPGIPDVQAVLSGRFQSKTGLGKGIIGSRRLMDEFYIESAPDKGTRIEAIKWFEPDQHAHQSLDRIRQLFFSAGSAEAIEELQAQNQELVRVLGELTSSRRDLEQANRGLQEANSKLKQVDAMKSQFISTIAHEVRTPLNAILGLVQLLERDKSNPLSDRQLNTIERLGRSASLLAQLVNDLLDLSRLQAGKMQVKVQTFDASTLLDPITGGLKQTASDKGVTLTAHIGPGLGLITSDLTKVTQVLTNLISNAIKFTPQGGTVSVGVMLYGEEMWRVDVVDTGIGVREEHIPLIFEEFRQVNIADPNHTGGTGLGLPISKRIVDLLGGRITVSSQPGEGSTFTVIWPRDVRGYVPVTLLAESES